MVKSLIISLMSLWFLGLSCGQANAAAYITTATSNCTAIINAAQVSGTSAGIVAPLVQCFTNMPSTGADLSVGPMGILPAVVYSFISSTTVNTYYINIVRAMVTLLVIIFGISIMTGNAQDFKKEGFLLLFKVAGVFYFFGAAPTIYSELILAVQGTTDALSKAASGVVANIVASAGGSMCMTATADPTTYFIPGLSLWQSWDCILGYVFGFSDVTGAAEKTSGIAAFLLLLFFTKSTGSLIFSVAVYVIMSLIYSAARFVHLYILAIFGFSFLFLLGYIFVPLILFKQTFPYFQKWLNNCVGQLLTPIVLVGYMAMMLVAVDYAVLSGPFSLAVLITGSPASAGINGFSDIIDPTTHPNYAIPCSSALLYTVHNNNVNEVGSLPLAASPCTPTPAAAPAGGGGPTQKNAGVLTSSEQLLPQPGTLTDSQQRINNQPFSITYTSLDLTKFGADQYVFVSNLLIGFLSSALLMYVMYMLLDYIPDLAKDLLGQDSRATDYQRRQAFGESLLRGENPGPGQGLSGAAAGQVAPWLQGGAS